MNGPGTKTAPKRADAKSRPRHDRPYHVVLLDDNDHTFEYVIEMLHAIFGHSLEKGFRMAEEVHASGRVIVATAHKELAALRKEQIENFGADPRLARCKGSMSAALEPAQN